MLSNVYVPESSRWTAWLTKGDRECLHKQIGRLQIHLYNSVHRQKCLWQPYTTKSFSMLFHSTALPRAGWEERQKDFVSFPVTEQINGRGTSCR